MASEKFEMPLNGPTYKSRGRGANTQECINWYPELDQTGKTQVVLYPTPGSFKVTEIGEDADVPIRGMATDPLDPAETIYMVVGDELFTVAPQGPATSVGYVDASYWDFGYTVADAGPAVSTEDVIVTSLGTMTGIATDTPIHIEINRSWVFIVSLGDGEAWTWNKDTDTLAKVTDGDYPPNQTPALGVNSVAFQDGYFLVTVQDSNLFYISDLNDPTSWDALNFGRTEQSPDALVASISFKREMWLIGKNTTEVWFNSGALDFPFEPIPNVFLNIGCLAPLSVRTLDDNLFFLSRDKTGWPRVVMFEGYQPQTISTPAIEDQIAKGIETFFLDTNVTDFSKNIVAYAYKERGHSFYVLTIPPSVSALVEGDENPQGLTLVYDMTTQMWHERKSIIVDTTFGNIEGRHFSGETYAMSRYKNYVGKYNSNVLYKLDVREFGDYVERSADLTTVTTSTLISRTRTAQYVTDKLNRTFWNSIEVDIQQGISTHTGGFASIALSWSDDQGQTFVTPVPRTIVTQGRRRIRWNRLGQSRDRVYRLTTSSPAPVIILSSFAEIYQGVF